jgi:hypothetical protein
MFSLSFKAFDSLGDFISRLWLQRAQAKGKQTGNGDGMKMGVSLSTESHLQSRRIQSQESSRVSIPLERACRAFNRESEKESYIKKPASQKPSRMPRCSIMASLL